MESTPIPDGVLSLADEVLSNEEIQATTECPTTVPSKRKATDNSTQGVVKSNFVRLLSLKSSSMHFVNPLFQSTREGTLYGESVCSWSGVAARTRTQRHQGNV